MATKLNPSQQDYDEKFRELTESPENTAFADQTERLAQDLEGDSFSYTSDPDREKIKREEKLGGKDKPRKKTSGAANDNPEDSLYNPESQKRSKMGGVIGGLQNSFQKGSSRKKLLIAASGVGGIGILGMLAFLLFMVISGFSVGQVAEVMRIANYSRLHVASYKRTSQYFVEKSMNPDADGFRVSTQERTLVDRFNRFDPNKVIGNLRTDGSLEYVTNDSSKKGFFTRKEIPTSELSGIKIGDEVVDVPTRGRNPINWLSEYRSQKEFVSNIESAIESSDLFLDKSRLYRTKTVNAILESSDIKLFRWTERGRGIKTFKDAVMSAYERIQSAISFEGKTRNSDIRSAAEDYAESFEEGLESGGAKSASEIADDATDAAASKLGNRAKSIASGSSIIVMVFTTYCSAREYVGATQQNAVEKVEAYKKSGALAMSSYDQVKSGDTTATAVMMEAKRWEGFQGSQRYQLAVGNPKASTYEKDLDKSEAPVPDDDSTLYRFLDTARGSLEDGRLSPLYWIPGGVKDTACQGLTSTAGQVVTAIGENAIGIIAGAFTGGGATGAQQGLRVAVQQGFKNVMTKQMARKFATGVAKDIALFLAVEVGLKVILNQGANPTVDESDKMYAKSDVGNKLLANEAAYAMGGRDLSSGEVSELNNYMKQKRLALLHKKPLLSRIASLGDRLSPASQTVASLPIGPSSLKTKSVQFASNSLNPVEKIAQNTSRIASSALGSDQVFATNANDDREDLDIPTIGWSVSELERMLEPDHWPLANAKFVEENPSLFEEYRDCFKLMPDTAEPSCDGSKLSSDSAFRYRLYQLDGGNASEGSGNSDFNDGILGSLLDVQEITTSNNGASPNQTVTPGQISSDSSATPCAAGTDDLGIRDDAYNNGQRIRIRLCGLNSITGPGLGNQSNAEVGTGKPMVSSVFSESWQKLGEAFETDNGSKLAVGSSWRTMTHQQKLYDDASVPGVSAATPGESNHQTGAALDISVIYQSVNGGIKRGATCSNPQGSNTLEHRWLTANASRFGIKNYAVEAWHWGPLEQC